MKDDWIDRDAGCRQAGALSDFVDRWQARFSWRAVLDNPVISEMIGLGLVGASVLPLPRNRRLGLRLNAARRLNTGPSLGLLHWLLKKWQRPEYRDIWREERIGWERYAGAFGDIKNDPELATSLLLKEPGENGEKGVLYCSFEYNWMKLLAREDAQRFFRDYLLVGASSWSPSDHAVLASLQGVSEHPAFIGISNHADFAQYSLWKPAIEPIPILASDWCDPAMFNPLPAEERTTDIVMVSHFSDWKRHWLLFEALSRMPPDLKVVLIGRDAEGRDEAKLRSDAKAFGVRQELDVRKNLEIHEVAAEQARAKVSVALSKREGSCVSVSEALFAGTPVGMMKDAHVGSKAYINDATGRILKRRGLHRQLMAMLEERETFTPREWAMANISAQLTSDRLNDILRTYCTQQGLPWTRDIAPMCWRYVPRLLNEADEARLQPGVDRLREECGIRLKVFVSERHAKAQKQK
jgi:glycosyltransferase involved in cell wall biosynthesis